MREIRGGEIGLDLPGADDLVQPVHTVGNQIIEAIRLHLDVSAQRGARARDRAAAPGRHPAAGAARRRVRVPALRRPAPARHDRDGARLRPAHPDRRRADHRARRHHPGPDPRPAPAPAGPGGDGDHPHHPRPGRGRRDVRRRGGDVPRPRRRARPGGRDLPRRRSIRTRGRCCARSRRIQARVRTKLPTIAGSIPHPYNRPPGCPFHPRCADGSAGRASGTSRSSCRWRCRRAR